MREDGWKRKREGGERKEDGKEDGKEDRISQLPR